MMVDRTFRIGVMALAVMSVVCLSGCLWPFSGRSAVPSDPNVAVEVLRSGLLSDGGAIEVRLFRPGVEAEATPEVDSFSLAIVQGAAEAINGSAKNITFFDPSDGGSPDLVVDGYVERFLHSGRMKRLMLKNNVEIIIQAEIKDVRSGEIVALIHDHRKVARVHVNEAARTIGAEMIQGVLP